MISLNEVNDNPYLSEFIRQSEKRLFDLKYTSHGLDHVNLVSDRARNIAKEIGLNKKEQELAAIVGYVHDFGNFLSRSYHNYFGALIFQQIFQKDFSPEELSLIMQAIVDHDREEMELSHPISAVVVLADKSDVRRERVRVSDKKVIQDDIHNRVNFATKHSKLGIDKKGKTITLSLEIDTAFVQVMEYFEIFTDRMIYCRKAAQYLGYKFGLIINNFKLL